MERTIIIADGVTAVQVVLIDSNGDVWSVADTAIDTYATADLADYKISLTQDGQSPQWRYTVPPTLPAGNYTERPYIDGTPITPRDFGWNGSTTTTAAGSEPELTFGKIRDIVRYASRLAGISDVNDVINELLIKDTFIRDIFQEFIARTKCTRQVNSISVAAGDGQFNTTFAPANFHPERILRMWATDSDGVEVGNIDQVDISEIVDARANCASARTLSAARIISIMWWPQLVAFTPGDSSSDSTDLVLNMPPDLAGMVAQTGVVAAIARSIKGNEDIAALCEAKYQKLITDSSGRGSMGAKSFKRLSVDEVRRGRSRSKTIKIAFIPDETTPGNYIGKLAEVWE